MAYMGSTMPIMPRPPPCDCCFCISAAARIPGCGPGCTQSQTVSLHIYIYAVTNNAADAGTVNNQEGTVNEMGQ